MVAWMVAMKVVMLVHDSVLNWVDLMADWKVETTAAMMVGSSVLNWVDLMAGWKVETKAAKKVDYWAPHLALLKAASKVV